MKSKKIVALICAVAILSISGICIANATTQTKEREMEYARDVADPNYEEALTAEQLAFNELINKQIYEKTADNLKLYEAYGLSYNDEENQLYFSEMPVCYFADNRAFMSMGITVVGAINATIKPNGGTFDAITHIRDNDTFSRPPTDLRGSSCGMRGFWDNSTHVSTRIFLLSKNVSHYNIQ